MRKSNATQPVQGVDPLLGRDLGEYRVLERIGEGGMGVVYRGVQPVIKKRVAIKVLKANVAGDPQHVRRLTDEAEAVNSIRHRNIIDIFSLGQLPDGRPYIVMEYLEGLPLDAYLREAGQLPLQEALSLLIAVCGPLAAAHRANVIHRDLKPSNVFVCTTGDGEQYLKLLDFGLAKKAMNLDGTTEQTSRAAIIGTPNYMAPEQARGELVSGRTDIYALGVMAYELLTGELPYSAPGPMEVLMLHVSGPIPSARDAVPSLPKALSDLVSRMMAKEPEQRLASVEQVRQLLIGISRELGPPGTFETLDPVSGEFRSPRPLRPLRPMVTPLPMPAPPLDETLISARTLRGSWKGRAAVLLGVIAALLGALVWSVGSTTPGSNPVVVPGGTAGAGTTGAAGASAGTTGAAGSSAGAAAGTTGAGGASAGAAGAAGSSAGAAAGTAGAAGASAGNTGAAGSSAGAAAGTTGAAGSSAGAAAGTAGAAGASAGTTGAGGPSAGAAAGTTGAGGASAGAVAGTTGAGEPGTGAAAGDALAAGAVRSPTRVKSAAPPGTRGEAPSAEELRKRVAALEVALQRATPAGEEADPAAATLLRKYRVEATMVDAPADRRRLAKDLAEFRRTFLSP